MKAARKGCRKLIRLIDHGFDRSPYDGQWGSKLMRDIGDKISSDSFHEPELGHILGHEKSQVIAIRDNTDLQLSRRGNGRGDPDGSLVIPLAKVFGKFGISDEISNILSDILASKSQEIAGRLVEPFDFITRAQDYRGVGESRCGGPKTFQHPDELFFPSPVAPS